MSFLTSFQLRFKLVTLCSRHLLCRVSHPTIMSFSSSEGKEDKEEDNISKKLFSFVAFVKSDKLNDIEKSIHDKHMEALQKRRETYVDPLSGYDVLTRLAHLRRGECCGNACRHCPYGQKSVVDEQLKKKYNSAFFV